MRRRSRIPPCCFKSPERPQAHVSALVRHKWRTPLCRSKSPTWPQFEVHSDGKVLMSMSQIQESVARASLIKDLIQVRLNSLLRSNYGSSLISAEILAKTHEKDFKWPELPVYKHTTNNLTIHLQRFKSFLILKGSNDPLLFKLFPDTLKNEALKWFVGLRLGSITAWAELCRVFVERFYNCTPKKMRSLFHSYVRMEAKSCMLSTKVLGRGRKHWC